MSDKPLTQHCAACLGHDFIGRQCRGIAARSADPADGLRDAIEYDAIPALLVFADDNAGVRAVIAKLRAALAATPTDDPRAGTTCTDCGHTFEAHLLGVVCCDCVGFRAALAATPTEDQP
jgi:hypothetical protein